MHGQLNVKITLKVRYEYYNQIPDLQPKPNGL